MIAGARAGTRLDSVLLQIECADQKTTINTWAINQIGCLAVEEGRTVTRTQHRLIIRASLIVGVDCVYQVCNGKLEVLLLIPPGRY